jgi:uncharacterized protein
MLRFNVEDLGEGREVREDLTRAKLDTLLQDEKTAFRAAGRSEFVGQLRRVDTRVLLHGELTLPLSGQCRRCLAPVQQLLPVRFDLNFVPIKDLRRHTPVPAHSADSREAHGGHGQHQSAMVPALDEEPFDGHVLDLEPTLREQILLALPMDALCSEACKGLCPNCGQNLNEATCDCRADVADPRWAKLRELKLSN